MISKKDRDLDNYAWELMKKAEKDYPNAFEIIIKVNKRGINNRK